LKITVVAMSRTSAGSSFQASGAAADNDIAYESFMQFVSNS